jgi:ADP-ribosylglycohydrolase
MVKISTVLTHKDKKAETGALIIAYAAYLSSIKADINPEIFIQDFSAKFSENLDLDIKNRFEFIIDSIKNGESTYEYCSRRFNNKGVSGYIYQTVPAVIHCWLRNQNNYKKGVIEIIECGGDTDTTAAILGAIIGAKTGKESIPSEWRENIVSWPYTEKYIETLLKEVEIGVNNKQFNVKKPLFLLATIRNLLLYPLILGHGFRRLLPPF